MSYVSVLCILYDLSAAVIVIDVTCSFYFRIHQQEMAEL